MSLRLLPEQGREHDMKDETAQLQALVQAVTQQREANATTAAQLQALLVAQRVEIGALETTIEELKAKPSCSCSTKKASDKGK